MNISELGFEAAFAALDEIVKKLESGQVSLEQSVAAYEQGMKLKERCLQLLNDAEMRIEKITPSGEISKFDEQ